MSDRNELREALADVSHEIWAHWMRYQFSQMVGVVNHEGAWLAMRATQEMRWKRQANTSYADLSESEKQSDRDQADKILAVFDAYEAYEAGDK